MDGIKTLSVSDISDKLGVNPFTVKRWISNGKLKSSMPNNRQGHRISVLDFENFLINNPKYNSINNRNLQYESAKIDILKNLMLGLYDLQRDFLLENHGPVYTDGWNKAIEKFDSLIKKCLIDAY